MKKLSFHLVTNRGSFNVFAPNALRDLPILLNEPVTEEGLCDLFRYHPEISFACKKNRMVGIGMSYPCGESTVFLKNVVVLPEFRKRGIARKIIAMLLISARIDGVRHLYTSCDNENEIAKSLYRSVGFTMRPVSPLTEILFYMNPQGMSANKLVAKFLPRHKK